MNLCYGCRVAPGQAHEDNCDWARCPDCGEQLIFHDCEWWEEDTPDRPAIWHGEDPREMAAKSLDWWATAVGVGRVPDTTAVLIAQMRGTIGWNRETQSYNIPVPPVERPSY